MKLEALKKAREEQKEHDFWHNKNPKCPHCGLEADISIYEMFKLYDDSDFHNIDCPYCGEEYRVSSHSQWTFSTEDQEEIEEEENSEC